jgi:predicted RNase H-like HicB family nuclease
MTTKNHYTAIIKKSKDGMYFGHVQEHPEARSQGVSIDDLKCNLADALREVLEMKKEDDIEFNQGTRTIKRKVLV